MSLREIQRKKRGEPRLSYRRVRLPQKLHEEFHEWRTGNGGNITNVDNSSMEGEIQVTRIACFADAGIMKEQVMRLNHGSIREICAVDFRGSVNSFE